MRWKYIFLVSLIAVAAYWPSLKVGFIWDDLFIIKENPDLRNCTWASIVQDFSSGIFNNPHGQDFYRPLLSVANRINYALCGLNPFGYHLFNLMVHTVNANLVLLLVLRLGFPLLTSFLCSLLFAVHPAIVQDLIVISGREELMSFCFMMSALILLLKNKPATSFAGVICYAMALASKESAIVLPFLFLLMAWFQKNLKQSIGKFIFLFGLSTAYLLWHQHIMGRIVNPVAMSLAGQFLLKGFPGVLLHYLGLTLWPLNLYTDRILPHPHRAEWLVNLVLFVAGLAWLGWKKNRLAWFCALSFAVSFAPKMALSIQASLIHDHWLYPALIYVLLPIGMVYSHYWNNPSKKLSWCARSLFGAHLLLLTALCHINIQLRNTNEKFYSWANQFNTSEVMMHNYRQFKNN